MPIRRTITRLTITLERIEITCPSGSPFPAARRVVNTTGQEVRDSELPPARTPSAHPFGRVVVPFRRAG